MSFKIAVVSSFLTEFTLANYFVEVFEKLDTSYKKFLPKNQKDIDSTYNLIFYIDDGTEYVVYPNANILQIFYIVDTHLGIEDDLSMLNFVDIIFCAQQNAIKKLEYLNIPIYWLPLACSEDYHHSSKHHEKTYDVGFIGRDGFGRRESIVSKIRKEFPNSFLDFAPRAQIGEIYAKSKIILNVAINNDINMRFFEALCSGSMLLTDNIIQNGQDELTQNAKEKFFVSWVDEDDLVEKIHYYLSYDAERERIAKAGRAYSLENQYINRWSKIKETISKHPIREFSMPSYHGAVLRLVLKKVMNKFKIIFKF
jgi:O-antigen biosynthesis protein